MRNLKVALLQLLPEETLEGNLQKGLGVLKNGFVLLTSFVTILKMGDIKNQSIIIQFLYQKFSGIS